jgi:flagellar biosynthesis protein FlhB
MDFHTYITIAGLFYFITITGWLCAIRMTLADIRDELKKKNSKTEKANG